MATPGSSPRERSTALLGAAIAFSSRSQSVKPLQNIQTGNQKANAVASSSSISAGRRSIGGKDSGAFSQIAAGLAAQRSPTQSPNPTPQRPVLPRSQTDSVASALSLHTNDTLTGAFPEFGEAGRSALLQDNVPIIPYRLSSALQSDDAFHRPSVDLESMANLSDGSVSTFSSSASSYGSATELEQPSSVNRNDDEFHRNEDHKPVAQARRRFSGELYDARRAMAMPREGRQLPHRTQSQLTVDSLADAMVASSLASSRAPSPQKTQLPPPRRHAKPHSLFHRTHSADTHSRTPSPSKGMRQTMRGPPKSDEEKEKDRRSKRNRFIKKHPHKHHEGSRKRWRDQITDVERKRYEGVWAANKGLLIIPPPPTALNNPLEEVESDQAQANCVLNIIARDIWSRSHLPDRVLEEVWDLVDHRGAGILSREEFVVGTWLIDQRLKGRKLPMKVSDSVWYSARGLVGIKIRRKH